MIVCEDAGLEKWSPNFSSSSRNTPIWTKARFADVELCNSLEWVDWTNNPVQVILCDECGTDGCASGGYVHVSRFEEYVLWTTPQIDTTDEWAVSQYTPAPALKRLGAIAIGQHAWGRWTEMAPERLDASFLPEANGRVLAEAWALGPGRPRDFDELLPMLRARLLGCDSLEPADALARIQRWVEHFRGLTTTRAHGLLQLRSAAGARIEKLYFDGPANEDWPALALQGDLDFPLLDRDRFFVPLP